MQSDWTPTGVDDSQCAHPEVLSAGRAQLDVVPTVVMDASLGQHGIVLHFRLPEGRCVVGQDDQLGFTLADHLLGLLVSQNIFTAFHHQLETGVDGLQGLFRLLSGNHRCDLLRSGL